MTAQEIALDAFRFYKIEVISVIENRIKLLGNYEIEIETNGLYKLYDDGFVVAPFNDINELCRFILL